MEKRIKQEGTSDIRRAILQAVIHLLKTKKLDKISVGEVAQEAHIARSSFYRYYDSVEEVVRKKEDEILGRIMEIQRGSLAERRVDQHTEPYQNMLARSETVSEYGEFLAAITGPNGDPRFGYMAQKFMRERFNEKLGFSDSPRERLIVECLTAGWYHTMNLWLSSYPQISPEEFVGYMYECGDVMKKYLGT